jgi:3-keto-L-gulonate-6-phosphate decarboxylase
MLQHDVRYLQLAFSDSLLSALTILPKIAFSERILIEAGTPFIKREGMAGIRGLRQRWRGGIVADLKTSDGGRGEVRMAKDAGATAATVMGSAPLETLNYFVAECEQLGLDAMIDMLGVPDPLRVLLHLRIPPRVVILHRGRDEETTRGTVIQYRHVKRVKSKYSVLISAAGGVDLREARSAIFNGANIVVVNIVAPDVPWNGIRADGDVTTIAQQFLQTIE